MKNDWIDSESFEDDLVEMKASDSHTGTVSQNQETPPEEEKKKKKKKGGFFTWILFLICLGIFCYAGFQLFQILRNYYVIDKLQSDTIEEYLTSTEVSVDTPTGTVIKEPAISVDFDALTKVNAEIFGWIYIPDTKINYPLVQGTDNSYYLNHTHEKNFHVLGSIFMDYRNKKDFSDQNTLIYGHNGKNGAMFGALKKYQEQAYYDEHPYVYILTPEKIYKYEIFAAYVTNATSDSYTIEFKTENDYQNFIYKAFAQTFVKPANTPTTEQTIITLSTCTSVTHEERFVVQAALVDSWFSEDAE